MKMISACHLSTRRYSVYVYESFIAKLGKIGIEETKINFLKRLLKLGLKRKILVALKIL